MNQQPDPKLGNSPERNIQFQETFTRGRVISDYIGAERARVVIDVGAYLGETSEWFSKLFPSATIWAIEPNTESFNLLNTKSDARLKTFNLAISDQDGQVEFHVNRIAPTSGIHAINPASKDSIALAQSQLDSSKPPQNQRMRTLVMESKTLNTFVAEHEIGFIDLLKIDVQGAEIEVIKGSKEILNQTGTILIEVSLYDYYSKSSSIGEVESILGPNGFTLWSVTDISNNPMNGRTDWLELFYVHENYVAANI